jgi:LDH2 family malate/lactate/ureidoglycolate dehydrogenase
MRVAEYSKFMEEGQIDGSAAAILTEISNGIFKVDGNGGFGIIAMEIAAKAMSDALESSHFTAASVVNVGHTGRVGAYSEYITEHCHSFSAVFGGGGHKKYKTVAPFGGRKGVFSTNPIAVAMPGRNGIPVSADFATSSTAGGKIRYARETGSHLPPNQVLDKDGLPTTDPSAYLAGGVILPSAGAKGTGLALICEILGYAMLGNPLEFNWFLMAFNTNLFSCRPDYDRRASEFLEFFESCPTMPGFERVLYPGHIEALRKERSIKEGLEVDDGTKRSLSEYAWKRGVALPEEFKALS